MRYSKDNPKMKIYSMSAYIKNIEISQVKKPNATYQTPRKTRSG
jgi:hypothetical protein